MTHCNTLQHTPETSRGLKNCTLRNFSLQYCILAHIENKQNKWKINEKWIIIFEWLQKKSRSSKNCTLRIESLQYCILAYIQNRQNKSKKITIFKKLHKKIAFFKKIALFVFFCCRKVSWHILMYWKQAKFVWIKNKSQSSNICTRKNCFLQKTVLFASPRCSIICWNTENRQRQSNFFL